jgi:hypothetical protein
MRLHSSYVALVPHHLISDEFVSLCSNPAYYYDDADAAENLNSTALFLFVCGLISHVIHSHTRIITCSNPAYYYDDADAAENLNSTGLCLFVCGCTKAAQKHQRREKERPVTLDAAYKGAYGYAR